MELIQIVLLVVTASEVVGVIVIVRVVYRYRQGSLQ